MRASKQREELPLLGRTGDENLELHAETGGSSFKCWEQLNTDAMTTGSKLQLAPGLWGERGAGRGGVKTTQCATLLCSQKPCKEEKKCKYIKKNIKP